MEGTEKVSHMVPKRIFLTRGVGRHKDKLTSFEMALRNAGIAHVNLVRVSSIFPPRCKMITKEAGLRRLSPGQITYIVLSENATNEPHRLVAASVGVAIPKDSNQYGYLSEYHSYGERGQKAGDYAEDLAATMLATILGIEFDPDSSYDTRRDIWKISGKIVRTTNVTQTAVGEKTGLWTSVLAGAVLIFD
jgi:arginine decarboxylase